MTKNDKRNLMEALNKFNEAAQDFLTAIYRLEDDTFNDMQSISKYPFDKSFEEVAIDLECFTKAVRDELADDVNDKPVYVRNIVNHSVVEDNKEFIVAQVVDEEDGKTYDMNVIILDEKPADDFEVVPFKLINYYHGEPTVEDTKSYIDDWKRECEVMMRVQQYLAAYLLTNEGCFSSPDDDELYNEPLVRQTLQDLRDIIINRF